MLFRLTPAIRSLCSIKSLQRQLGHRSATLTLDRYGHLFPDELDALSTVLEDPTERSSHGLFTDKRSSRRGHRALGPPLTYGYTVGRAGLEPATEGL